MGPLISEAQGAKVLDYIAKGRAEGARLVTGGERARVQGFEAGVFVQPTVFADVTDDDDHRPRGDLRPGDVRPRLRHRGRGASPAPIPRPTASPPASSPATSPAPTASIARLDAGTTWINAYNLTPVEMPFGGVKASGIGRENGRAALDHWSRVKSVYVATGPVEAPF